MRRTQYFNMNIQLIKNKANIFRNAIDAAKEDYKFLEHQLMRRFPQGCCGIVCCLLAKYLFDEDICEKINYVNGTSYYGDGDSQAHTWLQLDDIIIDITGDQFKYYSLPLKNTNRVYVGKTNEFYESFDVYITGVCEFRKHSYELNNGSYNKMLNDQQLFEIITEYIY